ncbi:hypothetical protein OG460_07455 [Streptomyces albidoflavus]
MELLVTQSGEMGRMGQVEVVLLLKPGYDLCDVVNRSGSVGGSIP